MARARNIKPSFFTSEQVSDNCPLGRLFFIGLWTEADHNGNLEWKPRTLKVKLLPFDDCDIEKLAINLDNSGLIRFYSVGGKKYINIVNFERHQNPHKNEKDKGTEIPKFNKNNTQAFDFKELEINRDKNGTTPEQNGTAPADSLLLIPDSPFLISEVVGDDCEQKSSAEKTKGTRLPKSWQPTAEDVDFCKQERPELNVSTTASEFKDYWLAIAGQKGVKLDWSATWRNWVRKQRHRPPQNTPKPSRHNGIQHTNWNEGISEDGRF